LMGQWTPVRTIMLWDFLRFQLVWLIFFISGFLALWVAGPLSYELICWFNGRQRNRR
jgi:hypothetical protein